MRVERQIDHGFSQFTVLFLEESQHADRLTPQAISRLTAGFITSVFIVSGRASGPGPHVAPLACSTDIGNNAEEDTAIVSNTMHSNTIHTHGNNVILLLLNYQILLQIGVQSYRHR
jgi:hypothetical protein